jgi:hypothetical protein
MPDAAICLLLVDAVVAVALMEVVALVAWRIATGRGLAAVDLVVNLSAGLCLLGALRCVLSGAAWPLCALWLAAAGAAHATDLVRRWRAVARGARRPDFSAVRSPSVSP